MNIAPIVCTHCGQDYARQYWEQGLKADPRVCQSCRRDVNPDAADAPRWTKPESAVETAREQVVSQSRKQCRVCGGEWDGLIFGSSASKGSPLPFGICPTCSAKDEARPMYAAPRPAPITLSRPTRMFGYDD